MNKLFTKIGVAMVGFAMAVGVGVAVGNNQSVEKASAAVATASTTDIVNNSTYKTYSNDDWIVTMGGNNKSGGWNGTASNRKTLTTQGYAKYADGEHVTGSSYAWVLASKNKINGITSITVTTGAGSGIGGSVYLTSSTNGTSYSIVSLSSGTGLSAQGFTPSASTAYTMSFSSAIESAYYAVIFDQGSTTGAFRFDDLTVDFNSNVPSIKLNKSSISGYTGDEFSVTATADNLVGSLAWKFGASDTGTVTGSATGTTYNGTMSTAGTVNLIAYDNGGEVSATCVITITQSAITGISLNKSTASLLFTQTVTLVATVSGVGNYNSTVTWSTDDASVATVSNGTVTAKSKEGTATITATAANDMTATCVITVKEAAVVAGKQYILAKNSSTDIVSMTGISSNIGNQTVHNVFYSATYLLTAEAGTADGSFAFKTKDGYLKAQDANNLYLEATKSAASSWTITENNDGSLTIRNVSLTARYLQYNASNSRFCCYKTSSNQADPTLILVTDKVLAGAFAENYMHTEIAVNDNPELPINNTGDCLSEGWYYDARDAFNLLDSKVVTELSKVGSVYKPYYDRLLTWASIAGETLTDGVLGSIKIIRTKSSDEIYYVIIVASITFVVGSGFFLLKKRRHN